MAKKNNVPMLKMGIKHSLQGRVRIYGRILEFLYDSKDDFLNNLYTHTEIQKIEYCRNSSTILINYNEEVTNEENIVQIVEVVASKFSLEAYKKEREKNSHVNVKERRLQEESVGSFTKRIGLTAGTLAVLAIKGYRYDPNQSLTNRLFSLPSLISIGLSTSIFASGVDSLIKTKRPNADTLTTTAIITAILTGRSMSALVTILLSDIAELMTVYTIERTRKAIGNMLNSGSDDVFRVKEDGTLEYISIDKVKIDDIISIQMGDKINIDGIVVEGDAYIDQSAITGEYFPAHRSIGERVFAGTLVKTGNIRVKTERIGDDTTVSRIIHLVEDAASKKAQIQTYADKFSAKLIPLNFSLAVIVYLATKNINRALSMLIIDYSCGVRLSTATALSASIHKAASNGVLIKGGNYIEVMANCDSVVLDKTGTMTEGKPKVLSIITSGIVSEKELLEYAAAAEEDSSHPLAHSILDRVKRAGYKIPNHGMTEVIVGRGVSTEVDGKLIRVGNKNFMTENNIKIDSIEQEINTIENHGESIIYIARDNNFLGVLGVHDALKENMKKSLNRLRYLGFDDIRLLTGDVAFQAEKMAVRMNMDDFESELMPEDKAKTVLQIQSSGSSVMMIGDGINDAPGLAYADVGIAIGNTRTDVAIESADITITNDNPLLIPSTVMLARKTMSIIKENFFMVIGVNSIGIVLSAIGLLPVLWGSVLHNSSTILVVLNSGRLLLHDFERRLP